MQFVAQGPDIPEALLQEHEDGRVVFFCGAGISYPAGLPSFKDLVDEIYKRVGTTPKENEHKAYDRGQFDTTLDLLERRLPGERIEMRQALAEALRPKLRWKGATDTHAALLRLSRCREGALRLVTTNFDHVFDHAARRTKQSFNPYPAPMLPIPKKSRWDGLVYLHGQLPKKADDIALNRLVITSGDFGLAYLTEHWAARFVAELFRNYVVCFVGYSINDPVLRYMMDALAADRMQGETSPKAYALGDCEPGREHDKIIEWEAKGVTPILYEVPVDSHDHSALHRTLHAWAETYRDGVLGRERIVVDHALAHPSASTKQDDFVGRMLWALSDDSGLPAKRFADFIPVPSLEWLEAFTDGRYQHSDLNRFGVPPHADVNSNLRFSLLRRPAPYTQAPWMALVSAGLVGVQWDAVMYQLARWLMRHLNDPTLVIWLAQQGGKLYEQWAQQIENELEAYSKLTSDGDIAKLEEIRTRSPNAIPSPLMQTIWRMLLTGRVKTPSQNLGFYNWKDRLKRDGLTASRRLELREMLAPKVVLRKAFRWKIDEVDTSEPTHIAQLVDWELELTADYVRSALLDMSDKIWQSCLPLLFDDFQQLLRDALDLIRELGESDDRNDRFYWYLPSISPHWQNRHLYDWVVLIELLRDAWIAVRENDPERARRIALGWFDLPYPTFKRLAFFAANQDVEISTETWVGWILTDDAWLLWEECVQREVMRLLVLQGARLSQRLRVLLETAIVSGPCRSWSDIDDESWQSIVDHSVWLRLAKLRESGGQLGEAALRRFTELSGANPEWRLADHEKDEFPSWMSGTGDPDFESSREIDFVPHKRSELVEWLRQHPRKRRPYDEDTWSQTCRERFPRAIVSLCTLAQEGVWPDGRWRAALQVWRDSTKIIRSWRYAAPLIQKMPDIVIEEIIRSVTSWMEDASESSSEHEEILIELCLRILTLQKDADSGNQQNEKTTNFPLTDAINHPVGHVAKSLLNIWSRRKPGDNDSLPKDLAPLFTQMCDTGVEIFRHGRVLLATRLVMLFRGDQSWTERNLLPIFNWEHSVVEAKAVWEGFLWSPRLYHPLLRALKSNFLSTARHYEELGNHRRQFAFFLTYAALNSIDGYTQDDFQQAIGALPTEGLHEIARALCQALEGASEQREEYWRNRVYPFWRDVWPKRNEFMTEEIAGELARLSIAAGNEFPNALKAVQNWLQSMASSYYIVGTLKRSGLCKRFPADSLQLLDTVLVHQHWGGGDLEKCLQDIIDSSPELIQDLRYQKLLEYLRRYGGT